MRIDLDQTLDAMNGMLIRHEGINGRLVTYRNRYGSLSLQHEPTAAGKRTKRYREIKRELGDDWLTDFENEIPLEIWAAAEKRGLFCYVD